MLTQEFIEHMRQRLLADKKKLQEELGGLEPHTELGDGEDAAGELALDEANQDIIAVIKADLAKIEVALQKIDAGTYGIDDNGVPISQERLEVNPYADRAL
ncbi:MAG: TraR/DksA family transcriptional regulator [Candidatus Doudnabacteria bacterium]|nr:TraR/DksA family transcriptional regulator [Candidatus Doudnabacteria bacterium]